ncbi:MAG: tungstate ABC transporter substrate-binding protein WtpA [Lentimicrobium sp.]|nr:tungstate ABC transporter substrate-binding protein WtpA [Lentimicrobium sp.]
MVNKKIILPVSLFLTIIFLISCIRNTKSESSGEVSGNLVIFHAGSLAVPIRALADSFNKIYPEVKILPEAAGSLASIRKITDLNRPCDILASADYILIDKLMIPEFASWNLMFAGNEMALVYGQGSKYADLINAENWYEILNKPEVRFGRSDPNSDPCGYRTILTMKLSEKYFEKPGLTSRLMAKDNKYIRPKEVDLLALLETGAIDYIFIYKSIAIQHKLPFVELNDSINLSQAYLHNWYKSVDVVVSGNKPGDKITQSGEAMIYGLTIPNNAQNPETAKIFIRFLIEHGLNIITNLGQSYIEPAFSDASVKPDFFSDSLYIK